jgi:hypothetical protein
VLGEQFIHLTAIFKQLANRHHTDWRENPIEFELLLGSVGIADAPENGEEHLIQSPLPRQAIFGNPALRFALRRASAIQKEIGKNRRRVTWVGNRVTISF